MSDTFSGIFFQDHSWNIIPTKWIFKKNGKMFTYWPDAGNVTEVARAMTAVKNTWTCCPFKNIEITTCKNTNDY